MKITSARKKIEYHETEIKNIHYSRIMILRAISLKKRVHASLFNTTITSTTRTVSSTNLESSYAQIPTSMRKNQRSSRKSFKLKPETKLTIIILVYLGQWLPSCFIWMIDSLCKCVPNAVSTISYWLTFTVSLTDPILILVLNSNY